MAFNDISHRHQKRTRSQARWPGFSSIMGAVTRGRLLQLCGLIVLGLGIHTLAHLEGAGFSGAVASAPSNFERVSDEQSLRAAIRENPTALLKMSGNEIAAVLSVPALSWSEAPTIVWQYRSDQCVLDVYMASMDRNVAHAPVIHYEARRDAYYLAGVDAAACIDTIVQNSQGDDYKMAVIETAAGKP